MNFEFHVVLLSLQMFALAFLGSPRLQSQKKHSEASLQDPQPSQHVTPNCPKRPLLKILNQYEAFIDPGAFLVLSSPCEHKGSSMRVQDLFSVENFPKRNLLNLGSILVGPWLQITNDMDQ